MYRACYMLSPVHPCVTLSHGWISQKWLNLRSHNFHHTIACIFYGISFIQKFWLVPRVRASNKGRVGKAICFLVLCISISKQYDLHSKLLLSCIFAFSWHQFDDHWWHWIAISLNFLKILRFRRFGRQKRLNKYRPVLSVSELLTTKCTFQHCIDCIDFAGCSSARGLQSKYVGENCDFPPLYAKMSRKW